MARHDVVYWFETTNSIITSGPFCPWHWRYYNKKNKVGWRMNPQRGRWGQSSDSFHADSRLSGGEHGPSTSLHRPPSSPMLETNRSADQRAEPRPRQRSLAHLEEPRPQPGNHPHIALLCGRLVTTQNQVNSMCSEGRTDQDITHTPQHFTPHMHSLPLNRQTGNRHTVTHPPLNK